MTWPSLISSIQSFETLPESILRQCLVAIPTMDEKKQLDTIKASENLRDAEEFMIRLSSVQRCRPRLEVMVFKANFYDQFNQFKLVIWFYLEYFVGRRCLQINPRF